jgi:hypothetical protein
MDPLTIAALGVGGVSALLKALGIIKSPEEKAQEKADAVREAQKKYLEANMPEFNYSPEAFDPAKHQDILAPMQERAQGQVQNISNSNALAGRGRGGASQELVLSAMRKGNQDIGNTMTGLARTADEEAYNRAMDLYKTKLDKAKLLASVQG